MKRTTFAALALVTTVWACFAGTMQTCSTTNELILLNPYTINTNTFVVSEGAVGDTTATVWTFVNGDVTGPDATHLAPTLYPAAGRWVKNAGGSGGTNIFNTIIVTNLTVISNLTADTLWTNKAGVLQPSNLTLPVMITNQLSFSEGMTNVLKRDVTTPSYLDYTNGASSTRFQVIAGGGNKGWIGSDVTGMYLGSSTAYSSWGTSGQTLYQTPGTLYPDTDNTITFGTHYYNLKALHERTNYIYAYHAAMNLTNTVRLEESMSGSLAVFDLTALTNNTSAPITGFSFRTNGVEIFNATGTGGPSSGANWVASGTTNSTLAGTATVYELQSTTNTVGSSLVGLLNYYGTSERWVTNTETGGTATLDMSATNRCSWLVLTGAVTLAASNPVDGNAYHLLMVSSGASNTVTIPAAWRKMSYVPPYLNTNNAGLAEVGEFWLRNWGTNVAITYAAEQ